MPMVLDIVSTSRNCSDRIDARHATIIALVVSAYLVGSIPSAYLIGRLIAGIDIREYGSGNVGASNVSVHVGKKWVVPIALFDVFAKGFLPVYAGGSMLLDLGSTTQAIAALAAMCGHNWPIFLKFSGGRGISVGIGSIVAYGCPFRFVGDDTWCAVRADAVARFGGFVVDGDGPATCLGTLGWIRRVGGCVRGWIRGYHDCPSSYIRRIQRFVVKLWGVDTCPTSVEPHDL